MKATVVLLLMVAVLATSTLASKKKHYFEKKHHRTTTTTTESNAGDELDILAEDEDIVGEDENSPGGYDSQRPDVSLETSVNNEDSKVHPCTEFHCGAGKECDIDENGNPRCVCVKHCPVELDERRKVCSNHNETWDSDCEVYRARCMCTEEKPECRKESYKHVHVDYFGACRELPPCTTEEMSDFPRRMRDWLFNVMKDMADRRELGQDYMEMEKEAERSVQHKWVNAVIWKFCELDSHPHDRSVSRHELFPIRAPLLAMEHCIAPFLDGCDSNDDHIITLAEWGKCLGLDEEEIQDKCPK